MKKEEKWKAWHIFYHDNLDTLLKEGIEKLLNKPELGQVKKKWFYIKYWEGGPHIRFRAKLTTKEEEEYIEQGLNSYLKLKPSQKAIGNKKIIEQQKIISTFDDIKIDKVYPDNSVIRFEYEPEYEKYGQLEGISIAEEHFNYSSSSALETLKLYSEKGQVLMAAAEYMLSYLKLLKMDINEMIICLDSYTEIWSGFLQIEESKLNSMFNNQGNSQIEFYLKAHLNSNETFLPENIYSEWINNLTGTFSRLQNSFGEINHRNRTVLTIVSNYVHVHNNRLGVIPIEEVYLSRLLSNSLKKLRKEKFVK